MQENSELQLYFNFRCLKGLKKRGLDGQSIYQQRLHEEMQTIQSMQYCGYFLIVSDVVRWALSAGIPVGPGRGSAGGSLVAYVLEITHLDPVKYGLIFERFLNPERVSMPDIDLDFCKERRGEIFEYVKDKYGEDKVAHIGTYGTMQARSAIKDVARCLGHDYAMGDKLSKLVLPPIEGKNQSLEICYDKVPELRNIRFGEDRPEKEILQWADRIETRIKSFGTHASGVVISDRPITDIMPLYKTSDGVPATQFEMSTVEDLGLIKFDFLGLDALTTIQRCVNSVSKRYGITIDPLKIPVDDEKTYEMLRAGNVEGVFQLEGSSGMRDLLVQIRPTKLEDLSVLVAIYRPGPLGCLSGDTKVLTGIVNGYTKGGQPKRNFHYKTIKELFDSHQRKKTGQSHICQRVIFSVNEDESALVQNKITDVYSSGRRVVHRILIQTGLSRTQRNYTPSDERSQRKTTSIKATKDHRFFTLNGWKRLEDIEPGEYIAIAHHSCFGAHRSKNSIYGKKNFTNIAFRHYQYRCVLCDWNDGALDVNHLSGNRNTDNSPENLCFMCPNHHRMYTEGTLTKEEVIQARETYRLPYSDQIMYVKYLGMESGEIEETYDIAVQGPHHNFIAGDFVVHNSDMLKHYLAVRAGETTPNYLTHALEPILGETDGMLIYQEQVLEICKQLAGYTMGGADLMRRAVGKKKKELMDIEHPKFIDGMKERGFEQDVAQHIWNDIEVFAGYGFNKAHAACYSYISYQMAWLKTHYPIDFMCACLVSDMGNVEKVIRYMTECKRMDIEVLPPSINESEQSFSITKDNQIRFGLEAIKNVGAPVTELVRERKKRGPFKDVIDLSKRVNLSKFNKRKLESLVLSGALDDTGDFTRASLIGAIENIIQHKEDRKRFENKDATYNKRMRAYELRMQEVNEFAKLSKEERKGKKRPNPIQVPKKPDEPAQPSIPDVPEFTKRELLKNEKELLGYFLSGHPLDDFHVLRHQTIQNVKEFGKDNQKVSVIALPSTFEERTSKKTKQKFAFLTLEDKTATISAVIWPKPYAQHKHHVDGSTPSMYTGRLEVTEGDDDRIHKLLVSEIVPLVPEKIPEETYLDMKLALDKIIPAATFFHNNKGEKSVVSLSVETSTGNVWDFGDIKCSSNPRDILVALKKEI